MEVLISTCHGSGWSTSIGMKYATDKELIKFRKQFSNQKWNKLAMLANYFTKRFYQKNMSGEEFFEKLEHHISSIVNTELSNREDLENMVTLLKLLYNVEKKFPYLGGLEDIEVVEVPKDAVFTIIEYDGLETVRYLNDFEWIVAKE